MANWNLPGLSDLYTNVLPYLKDRDTDLAKGLDPAKVTVTNPTTDMIRWNSATNKWEKYSGTVWAALTATYSINALTASTWATGRTITNTGDVTGVSAAFNGAAALSYALTLATVNSNVGTFGSSSAIPIITVNGKGLITSVSTAALASMATQAANSVAITGGAIANAALTLVQSTTAAPTIEGRVEWDTDNDSLKVGTGAATKTFSPDDGAATLYNKTFSTGCTWDGVNASTGTDLIAAMQISNVSGAGDASLAAIAFNCQGSYGTKLHLRADGHFGLGGGSSSAWRWYTDSSGNMVAAGNVTAYSDPRLKEGFKRVDDPFGILSKINGGTFTWKSGIAHTACKAGKKDYGILANEVEAVMPEIVTDSIELDGIKYKTVAYDKIVPVLIEALKMLKAEVEDLKKQLAE